MGRWLPPLLVATVLTQSALNLARPLVSYRVIALGGSALEVGVVAASFALIPLVLALPLGRASDRHRRLVPMLVAGIGLLVAGAAILSVAGSIVALAVGSAVLGIAQMTALIASQGAVARWSSRQQMDRRFGWFTACTSSGQLIGPLLQGLLLGDRTGDALASASAEAFLVAAGVAGAALPLAALVLLRTNRQPAAQTRHSQLKSPSALVLLRHRRVPAWLFSSLALVGTVDILTAYLPLIGEHRGISPSVVGVLLALRAGATICSRLLLHRLLLVWRHSGLIVASTLGSALAIAVVPLPGVGIEIMAAVLLVGGFFLGLGQPLTIGLVVRALPAEWSNSGLALRLVANRMGQVALPATAGLLPGPGTGALWLACAVLLTAAGATHRASGALRRTRSR